MIALLQARFAPIVFGVTLIIMLAILGVILCDNYNLLIIPQPTPIHIVMHTMPPLSKNSLHLFGTYLSPIDNDMAINSALSQVKLVGVMVSNIDSYAIIQVDKLQEKVFKTGEAILPGIVLERVLPDKVLILHDGVLEKLNLPQNSLHFAPPP